MHVSNRRESRGCGRGIEGVLANHRRSGDLSGMWTNVAQAALCSFAAAVPASSEITTREGQPRRAGVGRLGVGASRRWAAGGSRVGAAGRARRHRGGQMRAEQGGASPCLTPPSSNTKSAN